MVYAQVHGDERMRLARDDDDRVCADDGWREQRHKPQQWEFVGARDGSHRFVDLDSGAVQRRLLHRASVPGNEAGVPLTKSVIVGSCTVPPNKRQASGIKLLP
jgi:hypothetical protein